MITKNYKEWLKQALCLGGSSTTVLSTDTLGQVKNLNGGTYYLVGRVKNYPYNQSTGIVTSNTGIGFAFGTGTTPPTEDDNNLESMITSGLSLSVAIRKEAITDGSRVTFTLTVQNTSANAITINEVGYVQSLDTKSSATGTSASTSPCLLDRTVLDTPVTIEAGQSARIDYTISASFSFA